MPWQEATTMTQRYEFVMLAKAEGANIAALCRQFNVSRNTAYKWLGRFAAGGKAGLCDRSRRPKSSPRRTGRTLEALVRKLRSEHPAWGGRKIRRRLQDKGHKRVPTASTITAILHRGGLVDPAESCKRQPFIRFEHAAPNALLQIDFKGHFALPRGRCHPLTLIDDHSRFALAIQACANEQGQTVKPALTEAFRRYGLPERMTMDNGPPWGATHQDHGLTPLTLWLMRLGIRVSHSRPRHPQTQGKNERFNGTLLREVIAARQFRSMQEAQQAFDLWRDIYNLERPHEAIGLAVPSSRYRPSPRPFPGMLPPIEYAESLIVRRVQQHGRISFKGREFRLPKALEGFPVALEPRLGSDGIYDVRFINSRVATLNLNVPAT